MNRHFTLSILALLVVFLFSPSISHAQRRAQSVHRVEPPVGWFVGGSLSLLELGAGGDIMTPNGAVTFDVLEPNAVGLVSNRDIISETTMGLGWSNNQMPGGSLYIGYRSSFYWVTHLDMFWAIPKVSELKGNPGDDPGQTYLDQQTTRMTYHTTRLMFDWRPFRPLPLWYFTAGVEYVSFDTRLEFRWQYEDNGETKRYYENFEDDGKTFGFVIGTGLQFSSARSPRQEWFVNLNYAYVPFSDPYFAWEGDFLVGGMAVEGGFRRYFGRQ